MPELPEVETTRLGLLPYVLQQRITQIQIRQPQLRWPVSAEVAELLPGQVIADLKRRGKYLLFVTPVGCQLVHLGMSGSLRLVQPAEVWRKHDHIEWTLASGNALRFHDPRRFGAVLWAVDPDQHPLLAQLGPEPLTSEFTAEGLYQQAHGRRIAIKSLIMDSHLVVGVGNIYASEALFVAGIDPASPAGSISLPRLRLLVTAIQRSLAAAIQQGGTTLRDFVNGQGQPGYFQQQLQVYGRAGLPCVQCKTTLRAIKINQRTSAWCPNCQS